MSVAVLSFTGSVVVGVEGRAIQVASGDGVYVVIRREYTRGPVPETLQGASFDREFVH